MEKRGTVEPFLSDLRQPWGHVLRLVLGKPPPPSMKQPLEYQLPSLLKYWLHKPSICKLWNMMAIRASWDWVDVGLCLPWDQNCWDLWFWMVTNQAYNLGTSWTCGGRAEGNHGRALAKVTLYMHNCAHSCMLNMLYLWLPLKTIGNSSQSRMQWCTQFWVPHSSPK